MTKRNTCYNCEVPQDRFWWLPLCRDCRRVAAWAFVAGGLLLGAAAKLLTIRGWL